MPFPRIVVRICITGFAVICIFLLAFVLNQRISSININTDIKSMSPDVAKQRELQTVINQIASSVEQTFTLLLLSTNEDELDEALDLAIETLDTKDYIFETINSDDIIEQLDTLLLDHRFQLLTQEQRNRLEQFDDRTLANLATRRLYSMDSALQLYHLKDDPLGLLSDFTLQFIGRFTSTVSTQKVNYKGEEFYVAALNFSISENSLQMDVQHRFERELDQFLNEIYAMHPDLLVAKSGVVFFASEAAQKARRDISVISFGSTLGILLLLISVFRSATPLLLPLFSIAFGIAFAFAVCHSLYGQVHIITIVFGAGLIGVVIDYALHYFYHRQTNSNDSTGLYKALTFSLLTSIIGYSALSLAKLEALHHIALFSIVGLLGAWLSVIALGNLLIRRSIIQHDGVLIYFIRSMTKVIKKLGIAGVTILASLSILSFFAFLSQGLTVHDNPRVFFSPSQELIEQEKLVRDTISIHEPGTYIIVRGVNSAEVFVRLESITERIGSTQSLGINSLIPGPREQKENHRLLSRVYREEGPVALFFQTQQMDLSALEALQDSHARTADNVLTPQVLQRALPRGLPPLWLDHNQQAYAFILLKRGFDRKTVEEIAKHDQDIFFIDTSAMTEEVVAKQRSAASVQLVFAFLFISVLVVIRYRQWQKLILMLVPAVAISFTVALFQVLHIPITLFHVMAMFLVLGLGMDYVIFVSELAERNNNTLQAIILSALTSMLSFGLLALSSLPIVQAFGATVLVGNSLNLLGALTIASLMNDTKRRDSA